MADLALVPLQSIDAEAYWRVFVSGRSDLPTASVRTHLERYLRLTPDDQRTHFAFTRDARTVGTIRIVTGAGGSGEIAGFSMDPAHADLTKAALVKAVDRLRAQAVIRISASFEDRYEPAFAALGFRRWFARMRMEAATAKGPVPLGVPLRPPEEPEVIGLTSFFMDVYDGHMEQAFGLHTGSESEWRDYVAGLFKGDSGQYMPDASFVALEGERLVGAVLTTHWMETPLVAELGVAKDRRGRGLGRALLQATFNRLVDRDMPRLALFVTVGNDPAVRLYERMGFSQVGGQSVTARLE
ncbi:MAG: GNAT family N-acetyltransferase [Methanobacteriota archaeon]